VVYLGVALMMNLSMSAIDGRLLHYEFVEIIAGTGNIEQLPDQY
jgi:hypothetical protein